MIKWAKFTGKNINDLGDYIGCQNAKPAGSFIVMNYKLSIKIGICLFKECNAQIFEENKPLAF